MPRSARGLRRGKGQLRLERRRPRLAVAFTFFALLGGMVLWSSPALAISQRGHAFSFSFGTGGKGEGQLLGPTGVAVDASNGTVYVADTFNSRVEKFEPQLNEQGELVGEKFVAEFKVPLPEAIAVDNSTSASKGDVYVSGTTKQNAKEPEPEDKIVYKFTPEGTQVAKLSRFKSTEKKGEEPKGVFEAIEGLAVDLQGNLFVYDSAGQVFVLSGAEKNVDRFAFETPFVEARPGFAVDAAQKLYAGHQLETEGPEGKPAGVGKFELIEEETERETEILSEQLDAEMTTAVAVNPRNVPANLVSELNDVYIDNVNTVGGQKVTTVAAFDENGSPIQRFGTSGLREGKGVAVNSSTGAVYVADAASNKIFVFGLEPAGRPSVDSLSACSFASPPSPSCATELNATKLNAQVNPKGADTHAYFEYGPVACSTAGACAKTAETDLGAGFGDTSLSEELKGLAPGTYHYRVVAANKFGTTVSSEQTFSIAAVEGGLPDGRAWEMVSPPNKDGAEAEAITQEGGTIQAAASGGAFTYVADGPLPAEGEPEGNRNPELSQIISVRGPGGWASQDLATAHTKGAGISVGVAREYRAFSPNLSLGLVQPFPGGPSSSPLAEPPLSPPVSETEKEQEKTIYLHDVAQIQPEPSGKEIWEAAKANGERQKELGLPGGLGFLALVTEANAPGGEKFGGGGLGGSNTKGLEVLSATSDMSHVVLKSSRAAPGLYEWGPSTLGPLRGSLQKVSVLPGQTNPTSGELGAGGRTLRHAISSDGSRVVWTSNVNHHLYVRDTVAGETLQVDTLVPGASGTGTVLPAFQTASADGSKIFFTDPQALTPDSKAGEHNGNKHDLYVLELNQGKPLGGTLQDLTPEGVHGESADVLVSENAGTGGGVLGASEDGSSVYFVANGALTESAASGRCTKIERAPAGSTCNLYMRQFDGSKWTPTKLIAALSDEDAGDWGGFSGTAGDLSWMTSRVSPNGRYVAFMSNRSLTGYNNEDVTSKAPGERLDEEVFLYDASSGKLVCASCNPTGERPAGMFDAGSAAEGSGEGIGLVVDRRQIWSTGDTKADHWLAGNVPGWTATDINRSNYQSRYLLDSGRLYFNSPDHIVPAATGAKAKVYEYQPSGVGGCTSAGGCIGLLSSGNSEHETAFLDASENGSDVFFLSASKLVPQDADTNFDVYDARVCEPSSPCLTPPPAAPAACDETAERPCKGPPTTAPAFDAPPSATASGPGNVAGAGTLPAKEASKPKPKPLTRAQLLAKALKACHAKKPKKKRQACEKAARKKYGHSAKKSKKSKKASGHSGRKR